MSSYHWGVTFKKTRGIDFCSHPIQIESNPSVQTKKNHTSKEVWFFWRSERDLNPRAAFDGLLP